ncbi:MAG: hypothetical protein GF341_11690 [candidate division Zixibacteria bacterium]|nr:hypothetical protein [candidate division Zixibacteria bacterium]
MPRFIGEKITVETTGTVKQPVRFTWRDTDYEIVEIIQNWQDWGFSSAAPSRNWMTRRHRNYFRVCTNTGDIFEIYLDRSKAPDSGWYLYQQLDE